MLSSHQQLPKSTISNPINTSSIQRNLQPTRLGDFHTSIIYTKPEKDGERRAIETVENANKPFETTY